MCEMSEKEHEYHELWVKEIQYEASRKERERMIRIVESMRNRARLSLWRDDIPYGYERACDEIIEEFKEPAP